MSRIATGTRIGPYEVVSFLAAGGMGEVYRARDERLGRTVAMKVLPEAMFGDAEAVLRFEREARAAASVSHPNLISIHDVGRDGEIHYLVMDLLEGETLRERLFSGALPAEKAIEIAIGIAEGIAAVHANGFVHRDLKPENVFLTRDGWVKVLDFGLALPHLPVAGPDETTIAALTQKGTFVGTISYMAPEQLRGEKADQRADLFAIGCVLFEMLTGETLFRRESHAETIAAILTVEPVPPTPSAALDAVVRRCVARSRDDRFASATELCTALREAGEGRTTSRAGRSAAASIAVLPFANVGGDPDNDYFSEGLAEEILTALTRVPDLKVTARTSAFAFRGRDVDIRRIGEALGVRTILEGSVRRAGNRVRVTAQLVDAATGFQLWSARYDASMDDVFAVQDEIAAAIVDTLHLRLASPRRSAVPHTSNVEAWHAYLKSRYHFSKLTPERLALSRESAETAIALDPRFAAPHAQLAECFIQTSVYGLRPSDEMVPLARAAAEQAVALDPAEASAQMTLARIAAEHDRDWTEALRRCRVALACEQVPPAVRALCAQYVLWPLGRYDEVSAAVRPALGADPLSPMPRFVLAQAELAGGNRAHAVELIRAVIELHDHFWPGQLSLGVIHTYSGDTAAAIASMEKCLAAAPWNASAIGWLAGLYGDERGDALMKRLGAPQLTLLRRLGDASFHFVRNDFDRAAEEMGAMIDAHYPVAMYYATWLLLLDRFRDSAAGRGLQERMRIVH